MASKSDFSEEEWKQLLEAPPSAALLVIASDRGGSIRETFSMAKAYAEAHKKPGQSQLLDEIVSAKPEVDRSRFKSEEELKEHCLQNVREAVALLEQKAGNDEVESLPAVHSRRRRPGGRGPQGGVHGAERGAGERR